MKLSSYFIRVQKRSTCYVSGHGWTGALGIGSQSLLDPSQSDISDYDRDNLLKKVNLDDETCIVSNCDAGWGHSVLIEKNEKNNNTRLYIAGRPHDFHTLLKWNQLPPFIRRLLNKIKLHYPTKDNVDLYPLFTEIFLPNGEKPLISSNNCNVSASAGITAILSQTGKLYTFGLNDKGQCGKRTNIYKHIWKPLLLKMNQEYCIITVSLGLQHGLLLDEKGNVFSWGNGTRGQLGVKYTENVLNPKQQNCSLFQVTDFITECIHGKRRILDNNDKKVTHISAGWNHNAVITANNQVWIWGKNVNSTGDVFTPIPVQGLPSLLKIINVSCGSHQTAILMEDGSVYGLGMTNDVRNSKSHNARMVIPCGLINGIPRDFHSHFDRTTIVSCDGKNVFETNLCGNSNFDHGNIWTPDWVDVLIKQYNVKVKLVRRGWIHTLVITE